MKRFTTIANLRDYLSDKLFDRGSYWSTDEGCPDNLNAEIEAAIRANHDTFNNYGNISERELAALSRAVFQSVTGYGADYPFAQDDAERIAAEDEVDTDEQNDSEARLRAHGFRYVALDDNSECYERTDGQITERIYEAADGFYCASAPQTLDAPICVVTAETADFLDEDGINDRLYGYTLGDALAALDHTSNEYLLLSLRLHNLTEDR